MSAERVHVGLALGHGGFGSVYLAELEGAGGFRKQVALKILHPDAATSRSLLGRLRDEARLLGLLQHDNIIGVHGLRQLGDRWAVVMEYLPGVDLDHVLTGHGALPLNVVRDVGERCCGALDYAWRVTSSDGQSLDLEHRDVKPANLLVTGSGGLKVLDFGIARARFDAREATTRRRGAMGTPPYMPPERWVGEGEHRSDVFSLATTLLHLATALPPPSSGALAPCDRWREEMLAALARTAEGTILADALRPALAAESEARPTASQLRDQLRGLRLEDERLAPWCERVVGPLTALRAASLEAGPLTGTVLTHTPPEPAAPQRRGIRRAWWLAISTVAALGGLIWSLAPEPGPVVGATLRIGKPRQPGPLDPYARPFRHGHQIAQLIAQRLVEETDDGGVTPGAVASWTLADDHSWIDLTLRDELRFHPHPCLDPPEGRPATGEDLRSALLRAIESGALELPVEDSAPPGGATVGGPRTVRLALARPSSLILPALTQVFLVPDMTPGCTAAPELHATGTGPFRLVSVDAAGTVVLEASDWNAPAARAGSAPRPRQLEFRVVDAPRGLELLLSAELDILMVESEQRDTYLATEDLGGMALKEPYASAGLRAGYTLIQSPISNLALTFYDGAAGALLDREFRADIARALDRFAIQEAGSGAFHGIADRLLPAGIMGHDPHLPTLSLDAGARARLKARGAKAPQEIVLGLSEYYALETQAVAAQLTQAGLNIRVTPISLRSGDTHAWGVDMLLLHLPVGTHGNEPIGLVELATGMASRGAYGADRLRAAAQKVEQSIHPAARARAYGELEAVFLHELPAVPLLHPRDRVDVEIYRQELHGVFDDATGRRDRSGRAWAWNAWLE